MTKLEHYLKNLSEDALRQMVGFLMEDDNKKSREFVQKQVDEFARMYPQYKSQ